MPWIIKRHSAREHKLKVKRVKVRLVVQGQHMSKDKGDFPDVFSPVPHLSGVRCCMSMATAMKWKAVGVDLLREASGGYRKLPRGFRKLPRNFRKLPEASQRLPKAFGSFPEASGSFRKLP